MEKKNGRYHVMYGVPKKSYGDAQGIVCRVLEWNTKS